MRWTGRLLALVVAAACLTVLGVAIGLKPDPRGIGSHRQLRLQACQFEVQTGMPCPTCGMTTSYAHFVRGELLASLYVQPAGTVLAALTAMGFWAGIYAAVTGRPVHRILRFIPVKYLLWPLFGIVIVAWIWKIFIHVNGRDGWQAVMGS
jgi:hypothetical protein